MGFSYRKDDDLAFLEDCTEADIDQLAKFIIYDSDGRERITSKMKSSPEFKNLSGQPDQWRKSWKLVAGELQHFGGDTLVNVIRRKGVVYHKILSDVCKKLGVKFDKRANSYDIESTLIESLVKSSWEKMSESERHDALRTLDLPDLTSSTLDSVLLLIRDKGHGAIAIATLLAHSARLAFIPLTMKTMSAAGISIVARRGAASLANPLAAILISIPMFTGTAYRVTIPAVIQIAYMRRKIENEERFR